MPPGSASQLDAVFVCLDCLWPVWMAGCCEHFPPLCFGRFTGRTFASQPSRTLGEMRKLTESTTASSCAGRLATVDMVKRMHTISFCSLGSDFKSPMLAVFSPLRIEVIVPGSPLLCSIDQRISVCRIFRFKSRQCHVTCI